MTGQLLKGPLDQIINQDKTKNTKHLPRVTWVWDKPFHIGSLKFCQSTHFLSVKKGFSLTCKQDRRHHMELHLDQDRSCDYSTQYTNHCIIRLEDTHPRWWATSKRNKRSFTNLNVKNKKKPCHTQNKDWSYFQTNDPNSAKLSIRPTSQILTGWADHYYYHDYRSNNCGPPTPSFLIKWSNYGRSC